MEKHETIEKWAKEFQKEQLSEISSQLGGIFESIETVDFIPRIKEIGILYLTGKTKVNIKYVFPNSFMVTNISIKNN